ncbi:MAG: glycoside hydrolase family 97 protein [Pirellulales bacterium]|nr:glycoside hydrolase family 97 protein [Pirellulales bacterium]
MQRMHSLFIVLFLLVFLAQPVPAFSQRSSTAQSPDRKIAASLAVDAQGRPLLRVQFQDRHVAGAHFGLRFADGVVLGQNSQITGVLANKHSEDYTIPVGKTSRARDEHQELVVDLQELPPADATRENSKTTPLRWQIAIRVFNDGVAFRYVVPRQKGFQKFVLLDEETSFTFPRNATGWILPLDSYTTSYEKHYLVQPLTTITAKNLVGLPLLMHLPGSTTQPHAWVAMTEANLHDYAGMYLAGMNDEEKSNTTEKGSPDLRLQSKLSPLPQREDQAKVIGTGTFASPWRVLMIAADPGKLLESNIIFHLNPPSKIADPGWIKPGKTTFPWWNGYVLEGVDFKAGLNTATHKHYIDFCAQQGIPYHSLDGTDTAWYGGPIVPTGPTDVTKSVPEIDLPELLRYAQEKGVRLRLWMHWRALKPQIDIALPLYEKWGIEGIMVDFMDRDDQEMVAFYHEMAEKCAKHHLTLTLHGAYKPTGLERTWPNVLNYEGALNQEYDKWEPEGVTPRHNLDIAFVRMLAGPLDYHQGAMRQTTASEFKPQNEHPRVLGTRAHQLAMFVVFQDHLPMLVDFPAAYRDQPGLKFLVDVPTTWDETRVLRADVTAPPTGQLLIIARRKGADWYIGGMCDQPVELELPLDFLAANSEAENSAVTNRTQLYTADLYTDVTAEQPTEVQVTQTTVTPAEKLNLKLVAGGGVAAKLTPQKP